MSNARETILNRLRQTQSSAPVAAPAAVDVRPLIRDRPGADGDALLAAFSRRLEALSGSLHHVPDVTAAAALLRHWAAAAAGACVAHPGELIDAVIDADPALAGMIRREPAALTVTGPDFAAYAIGITEVEALVARTGSVLVSSRGGGRRLSVLPPFHVALARRSQLVPDLDEALARLRRRGEDWSYAAFITGPSRTADIEKILVLGAHGPKRLAVVVVD